LEPEFSSGQTQADGQTTNRHEEANSRFFFNFTKAPENQSVDFVQGNYFNLLWELHKIHKYISWAECRMFSEKPGVLYSNNWTLNVPWHSDFGIPMSFAHILSNHIGYFIHHQV